MVDSNRIVSLQFDIGDLPMIAHAFIIARATAMMCGNKVAKQRLNTYVKMIEALIPDDARLFDPEEWAEICAAIQGCSEWAITIGWPEWDRHGHRTGRGRIRVRVDGEVWLHDSSRTGWGMGLTVDSPQFVAVKALLEEMAGMDSKQVAE